MPWKQWYELTCLSVLHHRLCHNADPLQRHRSQDQTPNLHRCLRVGMDYLYVCTAQPRSVCSLTLTRYALGQLCPSSRHQLKSDVRLPLHDRIIRVRLLPYHHLPPWLLVQQSRAGQENGHLAHHGLLRISHFGLPTSCGSQDP